MLNENIKIDQTVDENYVAAGNVSFIDDGTLKTLSWNIQLFREEDPSFSPGVEDVVLTDEDGYEVEFEEIHEILKKAILEYSQLGN